MKTLWVFVSVLLCTGTFATEVQKAKACNGASCSPSLSQPYIVNDISSASNPQLVKPIVLDASQSRVGLHFITSDVVPPSTPGALPASQYYEPLHDDAGNPINLGTPPKLPLLSGHDLSGDTTEVEDQDLLDAIKGTYTVPPATGDVATFSAQIKAQAEAELAAEDGMVSTGSAAVSLGGTTAPAAGGAAAGAGSSTDTTQSDAALEAAMNAESATPASSTYHTPSEAEIDAQLARLGGTGANSDPRLHNLEAVEQTAKAQAAVMKRAAAIMKLLDKAYGELGAKLAAVATQRNALRHQYLNTREYLHALHLHALKLLKSDIEIGYTPADAVTTTPAAQFLNGLPASAASMSSASAILAKIQDLLLAASGQTAGTTATAATDSTCCGNDPISRELQALINGGDGTTAPGPAPTSTADEFPPLSSTAFFETLLSSSTASVIESSSTGSSPPPTLSSSSDSTPTPESSTNIPVDQGTASSPTGGSSSGAASFIDDAEFARVEALAEETVKLHDKQRRHKHKQPHAQDGTVISDVSVKETTKSTVTDMDDPKDWVKHFGEIKDAQTVSSIPAVPDPDHITLATLPLLQASLEGKLPKASDVPQLDPLPPMPTVSLLEVGSSSRATTKDPSIADLVASVKSKMAQTNSLVAQLKALKEENDNMATDPRQQAKMNKELAALQRGEQVFTTTHPLEAVRSSKITPSDMLASLRQLKEPDSASIHASDPNFPTFDELGLLELGVKTTKHHAAPAQPLDDDSLAMPIFPSEPTSASDYSNPNIDIVAAAMAVDPRAPSHKSHKKHHVEPDVGSVFLQVDSTIKEKDGADRNFKAEIAHQERVLDHLHNKYSHSEYTDSLREILGDPVMTVGELFPQKNTQHVSGNHPRVVDSGSVQADIDRNAQNMFQDVMSAAEGGDGDDVLYSHDSDPMRFREKRQDVKERGVGVIADVASSNVNDKYVFPELDIPDLHLKTVQTPSAQLANIMAHGPSPADNVDELIETYKKSLAIANGEDEQEQEWDDLSQLRAHTSVTPSVQKLLDQAQAVLSGRPLPRSHYSNGGLAGALSLIDEGLSHPVHEPQMTADEAYRKVLHATKSSPHKPAAKHHQPATSSQNTVLIQEGSRQHNKNHPTKDLSVDELKRLAEKRIKAGDKVVHKLENFQQEMAKKDPQAFKSLGLHNLLHEPVTHHHHHQQPSAMLETSSTITHPKHQSDEIPDILLEQAARKATDTAEEGIEALLRQADGAINSNKKLVNDMSEAHKKMASIRREYESLAKSDAADVATLRREEALITRATKTTSPHHHAKSAAELSNEELSLLEDAATTMEHKKGARRVRAKMEAQSDKHRRRRKHHGS